MSERTPSPDEHLRQALRHAPDADVSAPAYLRAQIVAAAHRSATQPAAAKPASHWAARSVPRWGASGALATVALAGFMSLLWRGESPAPLADKPAPVEAQAPAPAPVPSPVPSPGLATQPPPSVATPALAEKLATANKPAPPRAPSLRAVPPQGAELAGATQATRTSRKEVTEAPTPTPTPTPTPALANARLAADAMVSISPTTQAAPAAVLAATPGAPASTTAVAATAAPATALRQHTSAAAALSVAAPWPWRETMQDGDELQWWPAGHSRRVTSAGLQQLTQATRGRWQPVQDTPSTQQVQQLRWQRGDITLGRFWFEPAAVLWCGPGPPCQRAALDRPAMRALLSALGQ